MPTNIETIKNIETANFYSEKDNSLNIGNVGIFNFYSKKNNSLSSNIPLPKGFIGREEELIALREARTKSITSFVLHGAGGVGKTDLALRFIQETKTDNQKAYQINMFGLGEEPISWKDAMLEVIKMFEPDVSPDLSELVIKQLYTALLNEHKPILLFDNAKDRDQVEILNNASAFIVITSRNTFTVTGGLNKEVEQMSPGDARELLYSITNDEKRFDGEAENLADLAGYLPMALLPLAGLLAEDLTLDAKELVRKYSDRKERLRLADPNRENLSVEASFDLSYELLSSELKECWRKLAVFPADFDLQAMQSVWEIEDGKEIRSELIKRHLLEFNAQTKRLHLHNLARDYTQEKIAWKELKSTKVLHSTYYAQVVGGLDKVTPENSAVFDLEKINIESGFSWIQNNKNNKYWHRVCLGYLSASNDILRIKLHSETYIDWLRTGIVAARKLRDSEFEMLNWGNLGIAYSNLSRYEESIKCLEKALELAQKSGNLYYEAISFHELGINFLFLDKYRKAIRFSREAVKKLEMIDQRPLNIKEFRELKKLESNCFSNLGNCYSRLGENENAETYHIRALRNVERIDDAYFLRGKLGNMGVFYVEIGKYEEAIELLEKSTQSASEVGDKFSEAIGLGNLGNAFYRKRNPEKAKEYYDQAVKIANEAGDKNSEATFLANIGNVYLTSSEYEKSTYYFEQGLEIFEETKNRLGQGNQLGNLGIAYESLGEIMKARDFYLKAIAVFDSIESPNAEMARQFLANLENIN